MKLTALKSGLFCLSLMSVASVSAKVLTVIHAKGTTQVDITRIDRIHFDSGNMNIEHSNGTHQIPLSDIENMRFDMESTSVDNVTSTLEELTVSFASGVVTVTADDQTAIRLNVYDLRGYNVAAADGAGFVTLDLNSLANGIYIVKANDKTIKFIR